MAPLLPDTKQAVCTHLQASPLIPGDVTVAGATTDTLAAIVTGTGPYVAVYRAPSPPAALWCRRDRAAINIQAWATSEEDAVQAILAVHDAIHTMPGTTVAGTVVTEVRDVTGYGLVPDPGYPDLARVTASYLVTARTA